MSFQFRAVKDLEVIVFDVWTPIAFGSGAYYPLTSLARNPLRDEGEQYADRLREAGNQAAVMRYNGMIHGFFSMGAVIDRGKQAIEDV